MCQQSSNLDSKSEDSDNHFEDESKEQLPHGGHSIWSERRTGHVRIDIGHIPLIVTDIKV